MKSATLTMGLLPVYKFNYRARIASVTLQGILLAVIAYVGAAPAIQVVKTMAHLVYTPIVVDTTPKWQPSARVIVAPTIARIVVPKPSPIKTPMIEPPKVEIQAKTLPTMPSIAPVIPRKPVEVGKAFLETSEKPTLPKSTPASQVQTGGFGDPNGVKGVGDGKGKLQVSSLGAFGMPTGPGYGNGSGGKNGKMGVGSGTGVQSSGFDSSADVPKSSAHHMAEQQEGTPLVILAKPRPAYTDEGRKHGVEGEVKLEVVFLASGEIQVVKVLQGLGYGLDQEAIRAAEQIKFKPAQLAGQAIDSKKVVFIIFELAS